MSDRRELAVCREYAEIKALALDAFRARATELNIARTEIDRLCGFTPGYAAKLLGPVPLRDFSPESFTRLLQGLGLAIAIIVDPRATAFSSQIGKVPVRKHRMPAFGEHDVITIRRTRRKMRQLARLGAKKRNENLTAKRREKLARRAARARWRRLRRRAARVSSAQAAQNTCGPSGC